MSPSSEEDVSGMEAVCSSTASLQVGYDSPALVSYTSTSTTNTLSDQFDDAPEEEDVESESTKSPSDDVKTTTDKPIPAASVSLNPLDALAMACATAQTNGIEDEKSKQKQQGKSTPKNDNANPRPIVPKSKSSKSVSASPSKQDLLLASNSISSSDVLCGRGGLTNHHPGNVFFRRLVRLQQEAYLRASKREKAGVAKDIVEQVRQAGGKFLKKDPKNPGMWIDIGDKKAREKTSQALREGAPELREELVAAATNTTNPTTEHQQQRQHQLQRQVSPTSSDAAAATVASMGSDGNRVRVVSSDSGIAGIRPLFHAIQPQHQHHPQPHVVLSEEQQHHHQVAAAAAAALSQSPHYQALAYAYVQSRAAPSSLQQQQQQQQPVGPGSEPSLLPSPGSKRSLTEDPSTSDEETKRGPRLKLLKSRLKRQASTEGN